MKIDINELNELPPIFIKNKTNIIKEKENIEKRNAVIDDFLNNLDNKKKELNKSWFNENDEEDEIDDIFKNAKILKKDNNNNTRINDKIKRPKFYGRKMTSLLLKDKNELNSHKCSTLSFENDFYSNCNDNNKIEILNNNDKHSITNIYKNNSNINEKCELLPILGIKKLKLRKIKLSNHFLTNINSNFIKSETNLNNNITKKKNNNSKWTNGQLLDNINGYFSKDPPLFNYTNSLNKTRSKSHMGNRFQNNNLRTINKDKIDKINLSPNLIAAQLYRHNSFFQKGLKRNYTAKLNNKTKSINSFLSIKDTNKNNILKSINNNKLYLKNKSLRKIVNRNENFGLNWIKTKINNENKIINKKELSKKQLKLKLTELETNYKLRNDYNLFINEKK